MLTSCSSTSSLRQPSSQGEGVLSSMQSSSESTVFKLEEAPLQLYWSFSYPQSGNKLVQQQLQTSLQNQATQIEQEMAAVGKDDPIRQTELKQNYAKALAQLIQVQSLAGDIKAASDNALKGMKLTPDHPQLLMASAFVYYQNKQRGMAKYQLNRVRALADLAPLVENNYGVMAYAEGKTYQAIEAFRKALSQKTDYWVAGRNLALVFYQNNDYSAALAVVQQTYTASFLEQERNYLLGVLQCADRKYDGCIEALEKVHESSVTERGAFPDLYYALGAAYWLRYQSFPPENKSENDLKQALQYLERYFQLRGVSMAPDHEVRQWLTQIRTLVKT